MTGKYRDMSQVKVAAGLFLENRQWQKLFYMKKSTSIIQNPLYLVLIFAGFLLFFDKNGKNGKR